MASLILAESPPWSIRLSQKSRAITSTSLKNYKRLLRLEVEKRHATNRDRERSGSRRYASEIVANLKSKYGDDLTTEFHVDPELLGGMRIRVGSDVWDGSVRNRLERLQQEL